MKVLADLLDRTIFLVIAHRKLQSTLCGNCLWNEKARQKMSGLWLASHQMFLDIEILIKIFVVACFIMSI